MLSRIFMLVLLLFVVVFAQTTPPEFDFATLGVDMVVVGIIIAVVQFFKKFLPANLPWMPIVASAALSVIYAVVTNLDQPLTTIIKLAFTFAAAAAWTYEFGKSTLKTFKKSDTPNP